MDSCFTAWSAVDWKRARSGRPSDVCTEENVNSVQNTILNDRRLTEDMLLYHISSDVLSHRKVAHGGCQECRLLKSRRPISACKLPVVISTCTWQILASFFVSKWPWMRSVLTISTQKWNDKVCSRITQPHLQWSSFKRPQCYGVCILG